MALPDRLPSLKDKLRKQAEKEAKKQVEEALDESEVSDAKEEVIRVNKVVKKNQRSRTSKLIKLIEKND